MIVDRFDEQATIAGAAGGHRHRATDRWSDEQELPPLVRVVSRFGVLIEAVEELKPQNEALRSRIEALEEARK